MLLRTVSIDDQEWPMFRVKNQKEWENLVLKGLSGEIWALEVAAETAIDLIKEPEELDSRVKDFLAHLIWLADNCESLVSWITKPSCKKLREEFLKLRSEIPPRRMSLPLSDHILLKRMFNSIPVLWAEEFQ